MTKKEKVYKQIFNDIEADLSNSQLWWGIHKLEYTRLDVGMDQNEILPDEMLFKEGFIPKLWLILILMIPTLFLLIIIDFEDYIIIIPFFIFIIFAIGFILYSKAARSSIVLSNQSIKLDSQKEILWKDILDTYIKVIPFGKNTKEYFIISLQDETFIEQEISLTFGSKYNNIAHYTEMYKKKYYCNNDRLK